MKLSRWKLCLLVPVALVAAACGADDGGPVGGPASSPTTGSTDDLDDDATDDGTHDGTGDAPDDAPDHVVDESIEGDWVLRSGHLDGEEIVPVDDRDVTMSIEGDQIGGTAACNGYGGSVAIDDEFGSGGSFVVGELSWTEMGCEPDVMELEQRFLAALGDVDSFELADTLSLARTGDGTGLIFDRIAPVDESALVGTSWRLDTLITGDAASNAPGMAAAFLEFRDDGTLVGSTGCRRLEGEWLPQGATVMVPILSAIDDPTAGACAPESEALDGDIIAVVESGMTVEVDGSRLTLTAPGGDGLSFFADEISSDAGDEPDEPPSPPPSTDVAIVDTAGLDLAGGVDGQVVFGAHRMEDGGEEALLDGTLSFADDGCVRVDDVVLLWPFGTRWQAEPPAVLVEGLVLVAGDRIAAGGGFHDVDNVGFWTENDEAVERLRECLPPSGDGVFVIQHPVELRG